jgi:hypothetical protein
VLTPLILHGMHGIGDNLHERAIVRELMREYEVWLLTSWPQMYWDLVPALHLLPLSSPIPWMAKNEQRCAEMFSTIAPPADAPVIRCAYPFPDARATSVLAAMAKTCGVAVGDFRLPIAPAWECKADALLARWRPDRPLLITRPLLTVTDKRRPRSGEAKIARNPDRGAYAELFTGIRERYFVMSIADALPGHERVLVQLGADVGFHHGELDFETVAALTARAALVYCSPCFLTVLAQAVGTPQICVFGGFEAANSFTPGARFTPWLPIEPLEPCRCWSYACRHDKTIDLVAAAANIELFIRKNDADIADQRDAEEPAAAAAAHAHA